MPHETVRRASIPPFVTMIIVLVLLLVGGFVTVALLSADVGDACSLVKVEDPTAFWNARKAGFPALTPDVVPLVVASPDTAYGHLELNEELSKAIIATKGIERSDCPRITWDSACAEVLRFYKPVRGGCYTQKAGGESWDLRFSPNLKNLFFSWKRDAATP